MQRLLRTHMKIADDAVLRHMVFPTLCEMARSMTAFQIHIFVRGTGSIRLRSLRQKQESGHVYDLESCCEIHFQLQHLNENFDTDLSCSDSCET